MSSRAVSFSLTLHDSKQYGLDSLVLASGNSARAVGVAISAGRDVFGLIKTNSPSLGKRVSGGRGICVPLTFADNSVSAWLRRRCRLVASLTFRSPFDGCPDETCK